MAASLTPPRDDGVPDETGSPDPVERLAHRFWVDLQRRIMRRLPGARGVAGDGHFLVTFPPLAVLAPAAVVGWFALVGATRLGYDTVWTESLALMVSLVAIGTVSGVLGVLGVVAFAVGDFLVGQPWTDLTGSVATDLLQVRVPMVITYLLLAVAVVVVPRTGRALAEALGRARRVPDVLAWPIVSLVVTVVAWIGTRTWAAAAPTLVRPRFTWTGGQPTVEAIAPLQEQATVLVAAAIIAAIARQAWIGVTMLDGPWHDALTRAEARPPPGTPGRDDPDVLAAPSSGRRAVSDLLSAGMATLVLAGILEYAWVAVLAFAVFLAMRLLRSGVLEPAAIEAWKELVERLPVVVRLVVLWVLARVVTNTFANEAIATYTGLALFVIAGTVVVWLVFPGPPRRRGRDGPRSPTTPVPAAPRTAP